MKYIKKLELIDAIEFTYTKAGLASLQEFCGINLMRYGPHRTPAQGPWAYIKVREHFHEIIVAMESDMIIKHSDGHFSALNKTDFLAQYEPATQ